MNTTTRSRTKTRTFPEPLSAYLVGYAYGYSGEVWQGTALIDSGEFKMGYADGQGDRSVDATPEANMDCAAYARIATAGYVVTGITNPLLTPYQVTRESRRDATIYIPGEYRQASNRVWTWHVSPGSKGTWMNKVPRG